MGYKLVKYGFTPKENEQIEANINLQKECRSAIHGIVRDECGKFVKDAVVKLFKVKQIKKGKTLIPITHAFTDDYGQFVFGPLCPNQKYLIKIWYGHVHIREVEISPEPDCDDNCKDKCNDICNEKLNNTKNNNTVKNSTYINKIDDDDDEDFILEYCYDND